jgi:diguanylate cyclase (GGDEF)-like protein
MTAAITGLAYAEGSVRTDMTMLFTFVVIFAAYFLSWRAAFFQLLLIAVMLGVRLFLLDESEASKAEALRLTLLLPALAMFAALVVVLRNRISDREDELKAQEIYDFQTGLLSKDELDRVLDSSLERAAEHARPLSLVLLDVSGRVFGPDAGDAEHSARVATMIARSILGRIRVEDCAARLGEFRFAIVAPETEGVGASAFSRGLVDVVRKRLMTLGYESGSFTIAVGWADYPKTARSRAELLQLARVSVEASLASDTPAPAAGPAPAPAGVPRPAPAPPGEGGPEAAVG